MTERDDSADRDDLIRRLFYLLTAGFEDGATAAVDGQAGMDAVARIELANRLRSLAEEIRILADVVVELGRGR